MSPLFTKHSATRWEAQHAAQRAHAARAAYLRKWSTRAEYYTLFAMIGVLVVLALIK